MSYLFDGPGPVSALLTLTAFGGLGVVVAAGHELRVGSDALRPASAFLLALNALALAVAGWFALAMLHDTTLANAWLTGLAVVHIGFGLASRRIARMSRDLGLLALVLGVVVADVAFALVADGPVLTIGWALTGVGFAALLRRTSGHDDVVTGAGLGAHVALALLHTLTVDAPASDLGQAGTMSFAGAAGVVALAAACLVSGRLLGPDRLVWRVALDALGLAACAYLTALALDGEALALAWAAEAGALVLFTRHTRDRVAGGGALGFLALAVSHALAFDVPLDSLQSGVAAPVTQLGLLAAIATVALGAARLLGPWLVAPGDPRLRLVLDALGIAAVAYATALALDGELLTAALAAEAALLAAVSGRFQDRLAALAALAFLGTAAVHGIVVAAPPVSLVTGMGDPLGAVVALGSVAAATLIAGGRIAGGADVRPLLGGAGGVVLLYLASGLVVTPFESGEAVDSGLLSAHQQGQMVLSVFWALVGVCTLVLGLRRDLAVLRLAGLALLGVTVAKVFLFDLATLSSMYRVVSFIGLGVILLVGAFVWQRLRPRALPDLRETPRGVR
jgi:hypothetical protein